MVREFQRSSAARRALGALTGGALPSVSVACFGGGSNAIGIFSAFLDYKEVRSAAWGGAVGRDRKHSASSRWPVCFFTPRSYFLQDEHCHPRDPLVSSGLDYPGVAPTCFLNDSIARLRLAHRAERSKPSDVSRARGLIPAPILRMRSPISPTPPAVRIHTDVLVCLSGRGDKDLDT